MCVCVYVCICVLCVCVYLCVEPELVPSVQVMVRLFLQQQLQLPPGWWLFWATDIPNTCTHAQGHTVSKQQDNTYVCSTQIRWGELTLKQNDMRCRFYPQHTPDTHRSVALGLLHTIKAAHKLHPGFLPVTTYMDVCPINHHSRKCKSCQLRSRK